VPRATRSRVIDAPSEEVWALVSDPYNLPRWWPRTVRVESVEGRGKGAQWTNVLGTAEGRGVRADFRCHEAVERQCYRWEQQVEGTPFARHLRGSSVEIGLRPDESGTAVVLRSSQSLRGLSRLGSPMMRRGQAKTLEEALDGIERALT
jgi:uncharacterized protein YndB with AHSA1/START domain